MEEQGSGTLTAFYDLSVSPASYDFFTFLQLADLFRIRSGLKYIKVVFVPGDVNGFRGDKFKPLHVNQMMVRNVLIPGVSLLPSCKSYHLLERRDEASEFYSVATHIFPRAYTVDRPLPDYLYPALNAAHLRGEDISLFTAPEDWHRQARSYISSQANGKKLVTLTIRNCSYHATHKRQNNVAEWRKFLNGLDTRIYHPVIIPDAESPFDVPVELAEFDVLVEASMCLLFRMAIYENAHVNLFIPNGPFVCAKFSKSNALLFKVIADDCVSTTEDWFKRMNGTRIGDQLAFMHQSKKYVWEEDTYDVILREFKAFEDRVGSGKNLEQKYGFSDTGQVLVHIESVIQYLFERMNWIITVDDLVTLKKIEDIGKLLGSDAMNKLKIENLIAPFEGSRIPKGSLEALKGIDRKYKVSAF